MVKKKSKPGYSPKAVRRLSSKRYRSYLEAINPVGLPKIHEEAEDWLGHQIIDEGIKTARSFPKMRET